MTSPEDTDSERVETELSLLDAMYPDSITYNPQSREIRFKPSSAGDEEEDDDVGKKSSNRHGELQLRLPDSYPSSGLPSLISASDVRARQDLRERMRRVMGELELVEGEECLDRIIGAFEALLVQVDIESTTTGSAPRTRAEESNNGVDVQQQQHDPTAPKTVIIWLHHLLATSKRKLAINPSLTGSNTTSTPTSTSSANTNTTLSISGITKPGYPGIMIFSGAASLVDAHVRELKDLNWQAFQVRYDSFEDGDDDEGEEDDEDEESDDTRTMSRRRPRPRRRRRRWRFAHEEDTHDDGNRGVGTMNSKRRTTTTPTTGPKVGKIVEVETMAELVKGITRESDRRVFLRAVGVR